VTAQSTDRTTTPDDPRTQAAPLNAADTVFAMALLWAIPAIAFLLTLTRL
jgi:hypothetical protein